jgi:UDP-glucose 4-epimerase
MTPGTVAIVTGGAGFIGSHMVDALLAEGAVVRVIDNLVGGREANLAHHAGNSDLIFEQRDIRTIEPADALFADADYVFHFAGIGDIVPSIDHPGAYLSTNAGGTVNILEAARQGAVKKLVYAASSSCYGLAAVPTREDHPIAPLYPYALSKYLGELEVLHWHAVYGLPVNAIRIFNAYGTRARTSGAYGAVFGVFLRQKLAGAPYTVVGDGSQTRDFLYVTDVAQAFLRVARDAPSGEIYNLGAGDPQSVNRLVELLEGPVVRIPTRPGEPDCTWADIAKITGAVGWRPEISFADGVARILSDIDYWREAPLWDPDSIAAATESWFACLDPNRRAAS